MPKHNQSTPDAGTWNVDCTELMSSTAHDNYFRAVSEITFLEHFLARSLLGAVGVYGPWLQRIPVSFGVVFAVEEADSFTSI